MPRATTSIKLGSSGGATCCSMRCAARKPDAVITETFPFGRRLLKFELLALLSEAAQMSPRPKLIASVRDVLQRPRKAGRAELAVATARDALRRHHGARRSEHHSPGGKLCRDRGARRPDLSMPAISAPRCQSPAARGERFWCRRAAG